MALFPRPVRRDPSLPTWDLRDLRPATPRDATPLLLVAGALLVMAIGVAMRVYRLGVHPPGLYCDEADYGLDALRVLAGARPIYFPENYGREPLFIYLMAGTISWFGRNPLGVRAAGALLGLLTIPATYLLGRAWGNARVGLLSAAILAVTVWHVHLSRLGFRAVALPLFIALALGLGALAFRSRSRALLVMAGAAYGACFYTYLAARFTPVALVAMALYGLIWHRHRLRGRGRDLLWIGTATVVVVLPLAIYAVRNPEIFFQRSPQIAIWNGEVNHGDLAGSLGRNLARTPGMFTWRGDGVARYNVPERPVFDPLLSTAFLAAVALAVMGWRTRPAFALSLIWIAVMCLPTALSADAPHFLRAVGVLPVAVLLPALAIDEGMQWLNRRWARVREAGFRAVNARGCPVAASRLAPCAAVLGLVISAGLTARDYFGRYPAEPRLSYYFQAQVADLAAAVERARGTVYLTEEFWRLFASLRFLVTSGERIRLIHEREAPAAGTPPFTLLAWPHDHLPVALAVLPPAAQITVKPGPKTLFTLEHVPPGERQEPFVLYVGWTVERLQVSPRELAAPVARFETGLALLDALPSRTADRLTVRLRWIRRGSTAAPAQVVVSALDGAGRVVAAHTEPVGTAFYPPPLWTPGSIIAQSVELSLPQTGSAPLQLRLELYDAAAGRPLGIAETQAGRDQHALLLPIAKGDVSARVGRNHGPTSGSR